MIGQVIKIRRTEYIVISKFKSIEGEELYVIARKKQYDGYFIWEHSIAAYNEESHEWGIHS